MMGDTPATDAEIFGNELRACLGKAGVSALRCHEASLRLLRVLRAGNRRPLMEAGEHLAGEAAVPGEEAGMMSRYMYHDH